MPVRPIATRRRAARVARMLAAHYGSPHHANKADPLDELVFIVLSQMTTHQSFNRVYDRLKANYPNWKEVAALPTDKLVEEIADAGLSGQKAPRLHAIFRRLGQDFGSVTLEPLKDMDDECTQAYLTSLPGVD